MKYIVPAFCFVLSLAASLYAENRIPDGTRDSKYGQKPYLRKFLKDGKDSPLLKTAFLTGEETHPEILLESASADGITEINTRNIPVKAGEKYYFSFRFNPLSLGSGASVSCRVSFYGSDQKHLVNYFSKKDAIQETGLQDFLYSFQAPEKADRVHLTVWFGGIQKTVVRDLWLDTSLPPSGNADGNLIGNGSFETPTMIEYYIVPKRKGALYTAKDRKLFTERDTQKAKTGTYSLFCSSEFEDAVNEINLNMLPFKSGVKYRFSASYFVSSKEGKARVSGRVTYWDKNKKVIGYQFPEGDSTPGKWHEMKLEFYPPAQCVRITITLWISGKIKLHLDDVYFGEVPEKNISNRAAAASLLFQNQDVTLWKEAPYLKVQPDGIPEGIRKAPEIRITCAGNESEPFQLIVTAQKKTPELRLEFSDLIAGTNTIPAKQLSSRIVGFVHLKEPDNPSLKGWNADPILPEQVADAVPGRNLPFYVSVAVPKNQAPGVYKGTFQVISGTRRLASIPLTVQVRGFSLPEVPELRTYFYGQPHGAYLEYDRRPRAEIADNIQKLLKEHRMTGNQAQWPPRPKWKIEDGKLTVTDWSEFDRRVEKWYREYGMRNMPAPVFTMMGDNDGWWGGDRSKPGISPFNRHPWLSPEGLKYAGEFARQFTAHVRENYPDVSFYAYLYDEPPAKVHADLAVLTNALHKAAPELKIFIPKHVSKDIGYVHTWCVPLSPGFLHPDLQKAEQDAGREIWYYNWTVRLDSHEYLRNRLYPWQIYSANGSGALLWNTIFTPKGVNPWEQLEKTHSCGGATLFYPPRKAGEEMVPSLRSAQIKESIDDFDYMKILERRIDRHFPGQGRARVQEILRALIPDAPFGYQNDPHLLYSLRDAIADEIESTDRSPVCLVLSNPPDHSDTELSEVRFRILGPSGAEVLIGGKKIGVIPKSGRMDAASLLPVLGKNKIRITIRSAGKEKTLERSYERKPDPRLRELRSLMVKSKAAGINTKNIEQFLTAAESGKAYTEKERSHAERLIAQIKFELVSRAISAKRNPVNALENAMAESAKSAFERKQFEVAEYYLALAADAKKAGSMENFKVRIQTAEYEKHPAFILSNGILSATILETGGRLISFRVRGVECLSPGSFENALTLAERAGRHVTKDMVARLHGYGGYEDAGGGGVWPVSFVDWDVRFLTLRSDRISISFSTRLPDTPFRFTRIVTMESGSATLKMDYEITNTMPKGTESDDPEHYQLAWRGRFVPAIGSGKEAAQQDILMLPVSEKNRLAARRFDSRTPASYERRSIRLQAPWMGAFDPELQTGILMKGSPLLTHAYVWFNSKGDHLGGGKVYTLEFPRSFYGKVFDDPEANRPFSVKPGESLNFQILLKGLSGIRTEQQFLEQAGK